MKLQFIFVNCIVNQLITQTLLQHDDASAEKGLRTETNERKIVVCFFFKFHAYGVANECYIIKKHGEVF